MESKKLVEKKWKEIREEYLDDYTDSHRLGENQKAYDSYAVDAGGNVCRLYIGVEDESRNALALGIDEHITDDEGVLLIEMIELALRT